MQTACLVKLVRGGLRREGNLFAAMHDNATGIFKGVDPQAAPFLVVGQLAGRIAAGARDKIGIPRPRAEKLQCTRSQICIDQTPMVILPHQVLDFQLYIAQYDSR